MFNSNIKIKDVKQETGHLVRSIRKQHNLTQEVLAEQLNLSRITIQNLESGKNFTIDTLLKVLQHFDWLQDIHQLIVNKRKESDEITSLYE